MLIVNHPNLGQRFSISPLDLPKMRGARVQYERQVDVTNERGGISPAYLYTIEGHLFDGDCIMIPALTNKGAVVSKLDSESLAAKFLKDTIDMATIVHDDIFERVQTDVHAPKGFGQLNEKHQVIMNNILEAKLARKH